ncbi:MAG TPA: hypothetical protein VEA81_13635 [Burkholderiaceae bacterium]|nr:hypothetical protein [Burkholderiaceae bacterium]
MGTIEGIRKHGFRKWYERQLVESHVYLVTMVLALVMTASGWELLTLRESFGELLWNGALVAAGAGLAVYSWRAYARTMIRAERVGSQASCAACRRYGFRALPVSDAASAPHRLVAACRGCGHRWTIDTDG